MKNLWAKELVVTKELISEPNIDYLDVCRKSTLLDIYATAQKNGWRVVSFTWRYPIEEDIRDPVTGESTGDRRVIIYADVEYQEAG